MLIKITYAELKMSFLPALQELSTQKTNAIVTHNIVKTIQSGSSEFSTFEKSRISILESRCEKLSNGNPRVENQKYIFESQEVEQEALNTANELANKEVEIEIFPIKLIDIEKIEISAGAMISLREFISYDQDVKNPS